MIDMNDMQYTYKTRGVCSSQIQFDIDGDDSVITNIVFRGGCDGNLKAIARLVNGWTAEKIAEMCKGNSCGSRKTSCADQLAAAVLEAAANRR